MGVPRTNSIWTNKLTTKSIMACVTVFLSSRTAAPASPTSIFVSSLAPSLVPVPTASQFSMKLLEIRSAETLLTLSDRPTTYQSSVPVDTVPDRVSWWRRGLYLHNRQAANMPPRVLVDPHAELPLHSTPTEQDLGTQGANTPLCTDYVSPHAQLSSYLTNTV